MLRKFVWALILAPLAIIFAVFAVANRQSVVLTLDPFDHAAPAFAVAVPLFVLVLTLITIGVIVGGVAAWLRQAKWRRMARLADGQVRELRAEVDRLKRRAGSVEAPVGNYTQLTIPPPAA